MTTTAPPQAEAPPDRKPLVFNVENGIRSIGGYIKRGEVNVKDTPTFTAVEKLVWEIESSKNKPSGILIDTITGLASRASFDVGHDSIPRNGIWSNRFSLATTQPQWGVMSTTIILLTRVCRTFGIPLFFTAHEGERHDEASSSTMHFPDLNPMLLKDLVNNSDAVLRVSRSSAIFEAEGQRFPSGSRVIRCAPNDQYYAKLRVPDDAPPAPSVIGCPADSKNWRPAVERLYSAAQGPLECTLIYGAPGVGKTRLATEILAYYAEKAKQEKK
jgi:AAA domain